MRYTECKNCGKGVSSVGKRIYCKGCALARSRKQVSESSIKRMIRNREFVGDYKKDKCCEVCGYNKYPEILEFHHKEKESKNATVNTLMKSLKNLEVIEKEMIKCLLLCPNCHRELHLKNKFPGGKNGN